MRLAAREQAASGLLTAPPVRDALRRCIGSLDFASIDDVGPVLVRAGDADVASLDLLSPEHVRDILNSGLLRAPFFRMVNGGVHVPRADVTRSVQVSSTRVPGFAESGRVWEAMCEGATLVLESLHKTVPAIRDFCASLAVSLGVPVQANAYVTPPGGHGFAPHVDTHDVFVVQTSGRKHWAIRSRSTVLPHPVRGDRGRLSDDDVTAGEVVLEPVLEAGDCLYIPRGFAHSARAQEGETSIHVTIGLMRPTLADVAHEVVRVGDGGAGLRAGVSALSDPSSVAGQVREAVASTATASTVAELLALRLVRSLPAVPVPSLALVAAPSTLPAVLRLGAVAVYLDEARHEVVLPDREIEVPAEHWSTVVGLLWGACEEGGLLVADVADGGVARQLVVELVRQGVLVAH